MKRIAQFAVIGVLVAIGMGHQAVQAAVGVRARVFLDVNISLNGVVQTNDNGVMKMRIASRDVIAAIGTDSGKVFSTKAKLLLRFPVGLNEGPTFVVRDLVGTTNVDFEVSQDILTLSQTDSVQSRATNSVGMITGTDATVREFIFSSSKGSFDVSGYATASSNNRGLGADLLADAAPVSVVAKVSGTGADAEQNFAVLQGTIQLSGRKVVQLP